MALCFYLCGTCYFDYKYRKIPNYLLLFMMLTGIARGFIRGGLQDALLFLAVMAAVAAALYPFYKAGALGAGDVKLLGVCSGYLPYDKVLQFLLYALLLAVLLSLIKLFVDKEKEYLKMKIPLAGPVFGSVLLYMGGIY